MSTESLSETEVAVLRVDEEMEEPDTVSVSTRSSLSSDDSNQTNPLELGLVLNALQTTLVPPEDKLSEKCPSDDQTCYSESSPTSGTFAQQVEEDPTQFKKTLETFEIQRTGGHSANLIVIDKFDPKSIKINTLTPREQERADEPVLRAIHHLFNNRFMKAKRIFEQNSTR
jgi:hypothetical protein